MNFTLTKKLPIGISKYEWYTKLANAILVFVPNNARYILAGDINADLFNFCSGFIPNKDDYNKTDRYLLGTVGKLAVYIDKYMGSRIAYEDRYSHEDIINGTTTGVIIGNIITDDK